MNRPPVNSCASIDIRQTVANCAFSTASPRFRAESRLVSRNLLKRASCSSKSNRTEIVRSSGGRSPSTKRSISVFIARKDS